MTTGQLQREGNRLCRCTFAHMCSLTSSFSISSPSRVKVCAKMTNTWLEISAFTPSPFLGFLWGLESILSRSRITQFFTLPLQPAVQERPSLRCGKACPFERLMIIPPPPLPTSSTDLACEQATRRSQWFSLLHSHTFGSLKRPDSVPKHCLPSTTTGIPQSMQKVTVGNTINEMKLSPCSWQGRRPPTAAACCNKALPFSTDTTSTEWRAGWELKSRKCDLAACVVCQPSVLSGFCSDR